MPRLRRRGCNRLVPAADGVRRTATRRPRLAAAAEVAIRSPPRRPGWTPMRHLTLPACILGALVGGAGLLRLATRAASLPRHAPGFHHAWPLAVMGVGLLLAGAS